MARKHTPSGRGTGLQWPLQLRKDLPRDTSSGGLRSDSLFNAPTFECCFHEDFVGDSWVKATDKGDIYDLSPSGSPTTALIANEAHGVYRLKLAATSEAETLAYDWADQGNIPANGPFYLQARVRIPTAITTAQRVLIGLCSPWRANVGSLTSISRYAWFRLEANMNVVTELWDGTTRTTLNAPNQGTTALTAGTGDSGFYFFEMERNASGMVAFRLGDTHGGATRSLNSISGGGFDTTTLQPILAVQKDSGTGQPAIELDLITCIWPRF